MYQPEGTHAITPDCERSVEQPLCPHPCHATLRPTHVGTSTFANVVFAEEKTVLKSHSQHGHYLGIRPIRLPNRKLAWPIAEIENLFVTPNHTSSVKEAA